MDSNGSNKEQLAEGRELEGSGELEAAAAIYRKLVDKDAFNQEAVARLLVVNRKLGKYRDELAVIDRVLGAYKKRDKLRQETWVQAHSKAAMAGAAVFQKLGGASVSGYGTDPAVAALVRRREVVARKHSGKKGAGRKGKSMGKRAVKKPDDGNSRRLGKAVKSAVREEGQKKAAAAREREDKARERRNKAKEREEKVRARKVEIERRKKEAAAAKQATLDVARKAAEEKRQVSLFVITLRYRATLEKIDAAMAAHVAFLDRQYQKGSFLISGRQEARMGGIIIARGKDRDSVERLMKTDPFVKNGLASFEVVEFKASRMAEGLARYIGGGK